MYRAAVMTSRMRWAALIWLSIAVLLRVYGSPGGDAAIVGGLLFLLWTVPFGVIWQFLLYDYALRLMPRSAVELVGDGLVITIAFVFWFVFLPWQRRYFETRAKSD